MMHGDMETQIHILEQEAYISVLRAFKAQADAISWEKEGLITELRKELRVSDDEHRELLARVNADDIIRKIREWRQGGGNPAAMSASRKKQKTSQSVPSLQLGVLPPVLHSQPAALSMEPSPSASRRGATLGARGKKSKPGQMLPAVPSVRSMQYPAAGSVGRGQFGNQSSSGALATNGSGDPFIGRKVLTRWPADNNFYEAVITDYNPLEGRHALVYDINTRNETWEWVNLKEISPEDIRWVGEHPVISPQGQGGGRGAKKPMSRGGSVAATGRGRGSSKDQSEKELLPSQNGIGKKLSDDIEIFHTDTLIEEVERVLGASQPDPLEIQKAKKMLKEHEQALVDAISRLGYASDGESDKERQLGGNHQATEVDTNIHGGGGGGLEGDDRMDGLNRITSHNQQDHQDGDGDEDVEII